MKGGLRAIAKFAVFAACIAAGIWAARYLSAHSRLQVFVALYGYPGLLLVSFLSGFNLAVPVPAAAFLPALVTSGLDLYACVLVMSVGMTVADGIAFLFGTAGRHVIHGKGSETLERLDRMRATHSWSPILVMFLWACFAPLPNEVLAIPLGYLGFRARYVLPAIAAGNIVFNLIFGLGLIALYPV